MENSVCFIGYDKIKDLSFLIIKLKYLIKDLKKLDINNVIFVGETEFCDLCRVLINDMKDIFPQLNIKNSNDKDIDKIINNCNLCICYYRKGKICNEKTEAAFKYSVKNRKITVAVF